MKTRAALAGLALLAAAAALTARLLPPAATHAPAPGGDADTSAATAATHPAGADSAAERLFLSLGNRLPAPPSTELSLTDKQELIPDHAFHALLDSFLLNGTGADRMQALSDHLRRTLPASAAAEAMRIATRYQAYLLAYDELLAAQHFTSSDAATLDINRVSTWQQQRQQLRGRMLGEDIALEWFGNEDTYVTQALDEWRHRSSGQPPPAASNPQDQALHDQHMRQALNQAIASYQAAAKAN